MSILTATKLPDGKHYDLYRGLKKLRLNMSKEQARQYARKHGYANIIWDDSPTNFYNKIMEKVRDET